MARAPWAVLLLALGAGQLPTPAEYSAALTRKLTPPSVAEGTYRVYVSEAPLERHVAALRARDATRSAGEWEVGRADAPAVLGAPMGITDRARLSRLFGGRRLEVARGSLRTDAGVLAYTLVSPYPDASLQRIVQGTLIIEFRVPPPASR